MKYSRTIVSFFVSKELHAEFIAWCEKDKISPDEVITQVMAKYCAIRKDTNKKVIV